MNTIISLYDKTGSAVKPWANAGYQCFIFDQQHTGCWLADTNHPNIYKFGGDAESWLNYFNAAQLSNVSFVHAFPPCTDLAVSGARWFATKESNFPGTRRRAMRLVKIAIEIIDICNAPGYFENPISIISTEYRKPNYIFHPYEYAGYADEPVDDHYTKKTCIWSFNNFIMPPVHSIDTLVKPDDRIHKAAPGIHRADFRSKTPTGWSNAVFKSNHN